MQLYLRLLLLLLLPLSSWAQQKQEYTGKQYREDFQYFWKAIDEEYSYFHQKKTNWQKVKEIYEPMMDTVGSRGSFVRIMEMAMYELYDHHCGFNTNTMVSRRLVPTGADIWAEYQNGVPVVKEVRKYSGADTCGIKAGMEIVAVNDIPIEKAIQSYLPRSFFETDIEAKNFSLQLVLAGDHVTKRKLLLKHAGTESVFFPDQNGMYLDHIRYPSLLQTTMYGNVGFIRINNCLYNQELISAFDSAMKLMENTSALIVDLRETASGGNTTVARAIIGWFINKTHFYQQHEYYAEEKISGIRRSWQEMVSPRKSKYYRKPLAVLVNHWTGSVGEGIAIGFDGLKRLHTAIVGTEMAGLRGAVYSYTMPNTRIGFSFTAERLYHINGQPREKFRPGIYLSPADTNATAVEDPFIATALDYLRKQISNLGSKSR